MRRLLLFAAVPIACAAAAFAVGWYIGAENAGGFDPIEPARIQQFYGVARGENDDGEYCIENSSAGLRCAALRLENGSDLPVEGSPVRGGLTRLPSDSSDLPRDTWIWVTALACGWDGTEEATVCPETGS